MFTYVTRCMTCCTLHLTCRMLLQVLGINDLFSSCEQMLNTEFLARVSCVASITHCMSHYALIRIQCPLRIILAYVTRCRMSRVTRCRVTCRMLHITFHMLHFAFRCMSHLALRPCMSHVVCRMDMQGRNARCDMQRNAKWSM